MYQMLERYLPAGFMEKEEIDKKTVLRSHWKKLIAQALRRGDELSNKQILYKRELQNDIRAFKIDVRNVRTPFSQKRH